MMSVKVALAMAVLLAGCSSGQGLNPIVRNSLAELNPFKGEPEAGVPAQAVSRAAIEAADAATIRARLVSDDRQYWFFAASQNAEYVTYASKFQQTMTLRNSLITATRGLGADMLWVRSEGLDPLVVATPPEDWPARVTRTYAFPGDGPGGKTYQVDCQLTRGAAAEFEILEVIHSGVQFTETCAGDGISFENLHFADAKTGFVWRSLQWIGSDMDHVDLEVIEPFGD